MIIKKEEKRWSIKKRPYQAFYPSSHRFCFPLTVLSAPRHIIPIYFTSPLPRIYWWYILLINFHETHEIYITPPPSHGGLVAQLSFLARENNGILNIAISYPISLMEPIDHSRNNPESQILFFLCWRWVLLCFCITLPPPSPSTASWVFFRGGALNHWCSVAQCLSMFAT